MTFRSAAKTAAPPQAKGRNLQRDDLLRLEKKSLAKKIRVTHGRIWLTGTPASGDVILNAGDVFHFEDQWPYVIQALMPSQIFVA